MKSACRLVLCAAVLLPGIALRAQAPSILESKVERPQGRPPLWISAEAVADAEKIIDLDPIDDDFLRQVVEEQRRDLGDRLSAEKFAVGAKPTIATIPDSECKSRVLQMCGRQDPSATLADLATYSRSIVLGTVRSVDLGFGFGTPASLLGVEILEVIKGPVPRSPFYIDYPVARFRIGPLSFCNTNKGFEPQPGDQILLFDYTGPRDRNDVLYAPHLDQIFFQGQNGSLFIPAPVKDTPDLKTVRSLDEVVDRLRSRILPESRGGAR